MQKVPSLSVAQQSTVKKAEQSLTPDERDRVRRRMEAVTSVRVERPPSRGEGSSSLSKGKAVDPLNWGSVNIDATELDIEAQRREFETFLATISGQVSGWVMRDL